ncbi:MAG: PDZ domain-containing protein [Phycisphaerales bacterium]|nr:PDZ domain-containing protein [Phycisphaerales bacterium]
MWSLTSWTLGSLGFAASLIGGRMLTGHCGAPCPPENVVVNDAKAQVVLRAGHASKVVPAAVTIKRSLGCCPPVCCESTQVKQGLLSIKPILNGSNLSLSVVATTDCPPEGVASGDKVVEVQPTLLRFMTGLGAQRGFAFTGAPTGPENSRFEIKTLNNDDELHIVIENGEVTSSDRNGQHIDIEMDRDAGGNITRLKDVYGNVLWEGGGFQNGHDVIIDVQGQPLTRQGQEQALTPFYQQFQGAAPSAQGEVGSWLGAAQPAETPKVMMGVILGEPDWGLMKHLGLEPGESTVFTSVYTGFPADGAGLEAYDVIVGVNGSNSASQDEIRQVLRSASAGETVLFNVIHRGQQREVVVKLEGYDRDRLGEASRKQQEELAASGQFEINLTPAPRMAPLSPADAYMGRIREGGKLDENTVILERNAGAQREQARVEAERAMAQMRDRIAATENQWRRAAEQQGGQGGDRMERLEDRLGRLEKMLERLIEREEQRPASGGGRRS